MTTLRPCGQGIYRHTGPVCTSSYLAPCCQTWHCTADCSPRHSQFTSTSPSLSPSLFGLPFSPSLHTISSSLPLLPFHTLAPRSFPYPHFTTLLQLMHKTRKTLALPRAPPFSLCSHLVHNCCIGVCNRASMRLTNNVAETMLLQVLVWGEGARAKKRQCEMTCQGEGGRGR